MTTIDLKAARTKLFEEQLKWQDEKKALPTMMTADELMGLEFEPAKFVVPDLLCEGLSVFAGKPKLGKSWLALDWVVAISSGGDALGSIPCESGDVLMLALEDNHRRLQARLQMLGAKPSKRLTIALSWPQVDVGGIDDIKKWLDRHKEARLVVIDTLARVRPRAPNQNAYMADVAALEALHKLGGERGVAILVIHHTRKAVTDDWLESVSGTLGLTGVADSTIVLKRERGQADAFLFGTGRDLADYELPLKFEEGTCRWTKLDMSATEARATGEQTAIIDALRKAAPAGLMRHQIAAITGRSKVAVSHMLNRMESNGVVERKNSFWVLTC
jgi:RecA-family ATPase